MRYYRKHHLPAQTLALEPPCGWDGKRGRQSLKAHQWLEWQQSQQIAGRIQHAFNGGEQLFQAGHRRYQVDGFNATTQTVYEFHGCLWHGCPKCFAGSLDKTTRLHPDRTKWELFEATMQKQQQLQSAGYRVVTCWECQWNQLRQQPDVAAFLSTRTFTVPSLNPRDAFFGGRTNAVRLWHEIEEEGEEIRSIRGTWCTPELRKAGRERLPNTPHSRSVPLSPHSTSSRVVQRLCQRMAQRQDGSFRWPPNADGSLKTPRPAISLSIPVCPSRRYSTRSRQHDSQQGQKSHQQTRPQFLLGQIRGTRKQTQNPTNHHRRCLVRLNERPNHHHPRSPHPQRRLLGNLLRQNQRRCAWGGKPPTSSSLRSPRVTPGYGSITTWIVSVKMPYISTPIPWCTNGAPVNPKFPWVIFSAR